MCIAMNVFFHIRKFISVTMSFSEFRLKSTHRAFYWPKYVCINVSDVKTFNRLLPGTC